MCLLFIEIMITLFGVKYESPDVSGKDILKLLTLCHGKLCF